MDQDLNKTIKDTIIQAVVIILKLRNVDPETIALIEELKQA